MENAKNKPKKNNFQLFLKKLCDIYNISLDAAFNKPFKKVSQTKLLSSFFNTHPSTNNNTRLFYSEFLTQYFNKAFKKTDADYKFLILSDVIDSKAFFDKFFSKLCYETVLYFESENPFPWIDFKAIFEQINPHLEWINNTITPKHNDKTISYSDYAAIAAILIGYLFAYKGLRRCDYNKTKNIIEPPQDLFEKFSNLLDYKKTIIFRGDFRSGKTTFLKYYASKNRTKVFYLDAKYKEFGNKEILEALRPDIKYWTSSETKKFYIEHNIPTIDLSSINYEAERFFKKYLCNISENDILIIDNTNDISIVKKLEELPCKTILAVRANVDCTDYKKDLFEYYNYITIEALVKKEVSITDDQFDSLFKKIGTDVVLYKLIINAQKTAKNETFIEDIIKADSIDSYNELFKKYKSVLFSFNYTANGIGKNKKKNWSNKNTIEKHIANIYSDYFEDAEKKSTHQENRKKALELQYMRYLCRLKNKYIPVTSVKMLFSELSVLEQFEEVSWIKNGKIYIPDLIAYAFNRWDYNDKQIKENFNFMNGIIETIRYLSNGPVHLELYKALIHCFYDDFEYFEKRIKLSQETSEYRDIIYESYLNVALMFLYKYHLESDLKKILTYAKRIEPANSYFLLMFWNAVLSPQKPSGPLFIENVPIYTQLEYTCIRIQGGIFSWFSNILNQNNTKNNFLVSYNRPIDFSPLNEDLENIIKKIEIEEQRVIYKTILYIYDLIYNFLKYNIIDPYFFEMHKKGIFSNDDCILIRQNYLLFLSVILIRNNFAFNPQNALIVNKISYLTIKKEFYNILDNAGDLPYYIDAIVNHAKNLIKNGII